MRSILFAAVAATCLTFGASAHSASDNTASIRLEMQANHPDMRHCARANNQRGCRCALQVGGRLTEVSATAVRWRYDSRHTADFTRCMSNGGR